MYAYMLKIMKLKQKLHGNGEKYLTQYEEFIKIGDLFCKLNDFNNASLYFRKSVGLLTEENTQYLQEVYYKLARSELERKNYTESCNFFQNSLDFFKKFHENENRWGDFENLLKFLENSTEFLNKVKESPDNQHKISEIQQQATYLANEFIKRNQGLENDKKNNINKMILKINES